MVRVLGDLGLGARGEFLGLVARGEGTRLSRLSRGYCSASFYLMVSSKALVRPVGKQRTRVFGNGIRKKKNDNKK